MARSWYDVKTPFVLLLHFAKAMPSCTIPHVLCTDDMQGARRHLACTSTLSMHHRPAELQVQHRGTDGPRSQASKISSKASPDHKDAMHQKLSQLLALVQAELAHLWGQVLEQLLAD